jgi:predicted Zn-dependent peptidase
MRTAVSTVLLAGSLLLQAQNVPAPKPLRIPIQQYKLDNGLRIVFSEDHTAPT